MDKKEALQNIIYRLKEIEGTRLRLSAAKTEIADIELALLTQQIVDVYQQLKNYQSGLYASQPAAPVQRAAPEAARPVYVPEPKKEEKPAAIPEPVKPESEIPEVELKRETTDATQRKERLKRLEAEAARMEKKPAKPEPEITPEPKSREEDFLDFVEEKYEEADTAEDAAKASGKAVPEIPKTAKTPTSAEITLNEKLQSGQKLPESLNEKFQQGENRKTLAEKMKLAAITDLKAAIPLNQKIAFTSALFGGDDKEFKKAISFLNNCKNYSEAKFYLQSEIGKIFKWNDNDPLVQDFTELVYRKFI